MDLGGYSEEEIEVLTGCIPLLLNQCVVNGRIDLTALTPVAVKAAEFTKTTREKTNDVGNWQDWNLYVRLAQLFTMELTF